MFQLIYTSVPTAALNQTRAEEIAARARIKNRVAGVTGVLLISNATILQVLEGEEKTVLGLFELIQNSHSHTKCDTLLMRHCEARSFPNWSMGYRGVDDEFEIKMVIDALKARRTEPEPRQLMAS